MGIVVKANDTKSSAGSTRQDAQQQQQPFFKKEGDTALEGPEGQKEQRPFFVQRKLSVGKPNDHFEKEADAVADKVVQKLSQPTAENTPQAKAAPAPAAPAISLLPTPAARPAAVQQEMLQQKEEQEKGEEEELVQRKPIFESMADSPVDSIQRKPIFDSMADNREEPVQRKEQDAITDTADDDVAERLSQTKGSGEALPATTRSAMESSIGADFSGVRIHNNSNAVELSNRLGAQAFTHGSDIYFNSGKYDPASKDGQHLLAHELTHTVQQGKAPSVQKKVELTAPLSIQKETDEEIVNRSKKAKEGYLTTKGSGRGLEMHIKEFEVKRYRRMDLSFVPPGPYLKPKSGTRDTDQAEIWRRATIATVRNFLANLAGANKDKELRLTLKKNARSRFKKMQLVGKLNQLADEIVVPFWTRDGDPILHEVEHMVDWQILGADADKIENLLLLDKQTNGQRGNEMFTELKGIISGIMAHYQALGVRSKIATGSIDYVLKYSDIYFDKLTPVDRAVGGESVVTSREFINETVYSPLNDTNVQVDDAAVAADQIKLKIGDDGAAYVLPDDFDSPALSLKWGKPNRSGKKKLKAVIIKKLAKNSSGALLPGVTTETEAAVASTSTENLYVLSMKKYSSELKGKLKLKGLSPIDFDNVGLDIYSGVIINGVVLPTPAFLQGAKVSFNLRDMNYEINGTLPVEFLKGKLPHPFKVDYSSIGISASSNEKLSIGGIIQFSIEKVGKGEVSASFSLSSGFGLKGNFVLDKNDYFKKAEIGVEYTKDAWKISGALELAEGKLKGVKSGNVNISYDGTTLSGSGEAMLSIKGIEKVAVQAAFRGANDFAITGTAGLDKLPGIKSGTATITITNKGGEYELSMAGQATPNLPKVPGLNANLTVAYNKGVFRAEAEATYKKAMLEGNLKVGVTNGTVNEKGEPIPVEGSNELRIYGHGKLKFTFRPGVSVEISAALDETGQVTIWGELNAKGEMFKAVTMDHSLFKLDRSIPLVGVPFLNINLVVRADGSFYLDWKPLTVEVNATLPKTTLEDLEQGKLGVNLKATASSAATAGIKLSVGAGVGVTVAVITASGNITGTVDMGLGAEAGATVNAAWSADKGLLLKDASADLKAEPKITLGLSGDIRLELDLLISKTELYRHELGKMQKDIDLSKYKFAAQLPVKFDANGDLMPVSFKDLVVTPPFTEEKGSALANEALGNKQDTPAEQGAPAAGQPAAQPVQDDPAARIRKDVEANMRAKKAEGNADLYAYGSQLRETMVRSAPPELRNIVLQAAEDALAVLEQEDFFALRDELLGTLGSLSQKLARVDAFAKEHITVKTEDLDILRNELKAQAANSSQDLPAQRKEMDGHADTSTAPDNIEQQLQTSKGQGTSLPEDTRQQMEQHIGADFSRVNVHTGKEAQEMSDALGARAFTQGNDIYFNKGTYDPHSKEGQQLLAHELTHTVQQGAAAKQAEPAGNDATGTATPAVQTKEATPDVQAAPKTTARPAAVSGEVVNIARGNFLPSQKLKDKIKDAGNKGLEVNVSAGEVAGTGTITVYEKDGHYFSKGTGYLPLKLGLLQPANPMLAVQMKDGKISGFGTVGRSTNKNSIPQWLRNDGKALTWLNGIDVKNAPQATNSFENGSFNFWLNGVKVKVSKFADATLNFGVNNMKPVGNVAVDLNIKGMAKGNLNLTLKDDVLFGEGAFDVQFKNFKGTIAARFAEGMLDVKGIVGYEGDKLSGTLTLIMTDKATADSLAKNTVKAAGGDVKEAAPPAAIPAASETAGPRALAGVGTLTFHLTEWFAGSVNVIVDGEGEITVVGKIAPPKEILLFDQKDYSKELFKLEARAAYGLPVIGNIFVFANMALIAMAKVGPAKLYNIEIDGVYSTRADITKSISLSGSLNISAYAGLRLRAEGGAGLEVLDHDLKVGVGVNADAGVKGYVDARPTIGYRDPGEFFFKGHMEIAAQPFLGLSGDLFVEVDSPWWSPLPDKKWTWPIGSLEYALPGEFGIGADLDYTLGSGKVPEIKFGEAQFDGRKFMTDLVDDNVPKKGGASKGDKQGKFVDGAAASPAPGAGKPGAAAKTGGKGAPAGGKGDAPKGPAPKPAGGKGGTKDKKGKGEEKLDDTRNFAEAMKAVKSLEQRTKPLTREEITVAVESIKKRFKVPTITFAPQGTEWWIVSGSLKGRPNKQSTKVKASMKPGDEKDQKGDPKEKEKTKQLGLALQDLKAADKRVAGDGRMRQDEAERVASDVVASHKNVFKSISVAQAGANWKYNYVQLAKGEYIGAKADFELPDGMKKGDAVVYLALTKRGKKRKAYATIEGTSTQKNKEGIDVQGVELYDLQNKINIWAPASKFGKDKTYTKLEDPKELYRINGDIKWNGYKFEYETFMGKKFRGEVDDKDRVKKIKGFKLTRKPRNIKGRGTTQNPKGKKVNMDMNSSHLIADQFGGPGHKDAYNVVPTSSYYNKPLMSDIEKEIVFNYEEREAIYMDMEVNVTWGVLTDQAVVDKIIATASTEMDAAGIADLKAAIEAQKLQIANDTHKMDRVIRIDYEVVYTNEAGKQFIRNWYLGPDIYFTK